jgi:pseudoazurin
MIKTLITTAALTVFAATAYAETFEVQMLNRGDAGAMVFEPAFVKAQVGDVIRFLPVDKGHNVEGIKGMLPDAVEGFKSKFNVEFDLTVDQEGLYGIKCSPHYAMGMIALIQVGDAVNLDQAAGVKQKGKAKGRMAELFEMVD